MLLVTYILSYKISAYHPWGWHIINILLHALNVCLLYCFIRRRASFSAATMAVLIFAVHPLTTEPVNYISARSSILVTTFMLASILIYARHIEAPKWWRLVLSLILFFFGMLSKENGITLIGLVIAFHLLFTESGRWQWPDVKPWGLYFGGGIIYLLIRYEMKLETIPHAHLSRTVYENLLTQAGVLLMYFKHFLWPVGLSNEYDIPIALSLINTNVPFCSWPLVKGILVLTPVAAALIWARRRPLFCFGILWFYITIAPETFWPMNMIATDRRMYLPCIGLIFCAAFIFESARIHWVGIRRYIGSVSSVIVLVSLLILTIDRNRDWATDFSLWSDAIKKYPQAYSAYDSLGYYYVHVGKPKQAEWSFRAAIRINPGYYIAFANLGALITDQGRYEEAVREIERSLAITNALGLANPARITLGNIYARMGLLDQAEEQLTIAVKENPLIAEAHFNLGRVYLMKEKINEAKIQFQQAANLDPALAPEAEKAIRELK
jgi:tetratricopeptide (TPR) repeat protein